jgi:hypothetical protein
MRKSLLGLSALLCLAAACGGSSDTVISVDIETERNCEFLDPHHCLTPFPSDAFTREDPATATGIRVDFGPEVLLRNDQGVQMDPAEWNRNDGFSPGGLMISVFPGLDAEASALPPLTDLARSLDQDASIVLIDTTAGERVPFWSELDSSFPEGEDPALLVRPARALHAGHRHVIGLRNLRNRDGELLEPSVIFAAYRDKTPTDSERVEARRASMEEIFDDLNAAGIDRESLQLAWSHTVRSQDSLAQRLLHIRDEAFGRLGDTAPEFSIDSVSDGGLVDIVTGTFRAPLYLTGSGQPGSVFNDTGGDSLPEQNEEVPFRDANFVCTVPRMATPDNPARLFVFGHGLLGNASQTAGLGTLGGSINIAFCGADWIGMSTEDVPNVSEILGQLGRFREQADRLQQGHLEFLFLGRLMLHAGGLGSHPAFQNQTAASVLDTSDLFFLGASQGGILGGATTAIAQDWNRAVMAVGAADYSKLIPRSIDFDTFAGFMAAGYPSALDRKIGFGLMQMLWDPAEANGHLERLGPDTYPDTPPHQVLYLQAFGDHQVANLATEYAARSIGARVRAPALAPGRGTAAVDFWQIEEIESFPYPDHALLVWDFGTPAPPVANLPPREGEDPHGKPSEVTAILIAVTEYLKTGGGLIDVCGGAPCVTE